MSYLLMIPEISFSIPNTLRSFDTIHIRNFLRYTYWCLFLSSTCFQEGWKKGKQHKTIKSSRKKRFENIFCLGCERDFFFGWDTRENEEPQHMVHLFNVTIKQVILLAFSSSQYSRSLIFCWSFFITSATICYVFALK